MTLRFQNWDCLLCHKSRIFRVRRNSVPLMISPEQFVIPSFLLSKKVMVNPTLKTLVSSRLPQPSPISYVRSLLKNSTSKELILNNKSIRAFHKINCIRVFQISESLVYLSQPYPRDIAYHPEFSSA